MTQTTGYVSAFKPKVAGGIWRAVLGTTLPTNATDELDPAFKSLGYISEDGITNSTDIDSDTEKAWGGDTVNTINNGETDTFQYKLIETLNIEAIKDAYGDENVTGDLESGITVKKNSKERVGHSYVVEMIGKNGVIKRLVIPEGILTDFDDISYVTSESAGYTITLTASADKDGNSHYEYIQAVKG